MQLVIFILWIIFILLAIYVSFSRKHYLGYIALIGLGFGLFGILTGNTGGAGIEFLSQVDSNGNLIYTAHTAANDITVSVMGYVAFGLGMIGVIKLIAAMFGRDT